MTNAQKQQWKTEKKKDIFKKFANLKISKLANFNIIIVQKNIY